MVAIGTTRTLTPQFIKLRNEARRAMGLGPANKEEDKCVPLCAAGALWGTHKPAGTSIAPSPTACNIRRATARLVGAALDGQGHSSSDVELATATATGALAPSWVHKSEKIRAEMSLLKEKMGKLKE